VWDVATGQVIAKREDGLTEDLPGLFAFSPDGSRIAGRTTSTALAIWDAATGKKHAALEGHYHLIMCLAFNHDGTRLASAGWDRTVKIWDTETGQEAITLRGHPTSVVGLAYSPDGDWLASASIDNTLKLWDARPWMQDSAAEREALGLLQFFFSKPLCRADALAYAEHFPVTHTLARDKLLALARRYSDCAEPQRYHDAAWAVVRQPLLNTLQYSFALKQAETACRLAPAENRHRTLLGLAQYRAGNYAEAATTLTEADNQQKDIPANVAFLALAHHRLGQTKEAREALTRLRAILKDVQNAEQQDALAFLREAELLMNEKGEGK
jgi:WD40 domain-containing protein